MRRPSASRGHKTPLAPPPDASVRPPTAFERRLHEVCKLIPAGKVTTYGALAKVLSSSPRATGQALRRNPYSPVVPCHRVVAVGGALGGFFGSKDSDSTMVLKKQRMLSEEGVTFGGGKVDPSCILSHEDLQQRIAASTEPDTGEA